MQGNVAYEATICHEERLNLIADLLWRQCNFTNCLGAIDQKHVRIIMPSFIGSKYFNYKKYLPLVLASVDADYCFNYIDVGSYSSDSAISRNSKCRKLRHKLKIPQEQLCHKPQKQHTHLSL